jgi:hypothetical protein
MKSKAGNMAAVNRAYDAYRAAVEEAQAYDDVYFTLEYNKGRDDALAVVLDGTIDLRAVAERFAREDSQGGGRAADRALTQRWNKAVQVGDKVILPPHRRATLLDVEHVKVLVDEHDVIFGVQGTSELLAERLVDSKVVWVDDDTVKLAGGR